jgi:Icc-related predicted phosphoesterase
MVTTDLHSSPRAVDAIAHALDIGGFNLHICLGDIITFRPMKYLEDLLTEPPVPTYTVPGNTDSDEARARLEELGHDIHFKQVSFDEVTIAGAGGCVPPPFRTAFVVEEEEYAQSVPPILDGASILASHGPVYGLLDRSMFGSIHVGSKALFAAVERARPRVVLCGHIHEARGIIEYDWRVKSVEARELDRLELRMPDSTMFFNPGPAKDGYVGILDIKGDEVAAAVQQV